MLLYKNIIFALFVIIVNVCNINSMQWLNPFHSKNQTYVIFYNIVLAMRCSTKNTHGYDYLQALCCDTMRNNNLFSFLHKPFQINRYTSLISPYTSEHSLSIQHNLLMNNGIGVEEARITCSGKVSAYGIVEDYSLQPDLSFLEQALIGAFKEYKIDSNYEATLQQYSLYLSACKAISCQDIFKKIIKNELSYPHVENVQKNEHNQLLKRYFSSVLAKNQYNSSIGKLLYLQLCDINTELQSFPYAIQIYNKDALAAVVCEKYDIIVSS